MTSLTSGRAVLRARGVSIGYGGHPVVSGLDLEVLPGEIVTLLGANGAGKTTTLLGLVGELQPVAGDVQLFGARAVGSLHVRARLGLGFITEERSVIFGLSVLDNLRLAGGDIGLALTLFPELAPLRRRTAGTLSGGEQQILAFARALSRSPRMLIADELSLGLAPLIVERLWRSLREAAAEGVGVLVVEQQVRTALAMSDRAYVLRQGSMVLEGRSADLIGRLVEIEHQYLSA